MPRITALVIALLVPAAVLAADPAPQPTGSTAPAVATQPAPAAEASGLVFLDCGFENASPVWYEFADDGRILVHLLYDHERASPNRAAGHIHFLLHAQPGSSLVLEFINLDNVWNGRHGSVAKELKTVVVSEDGRDWRPVATEVLENRVLLRLEMPGPRLYVARVEPYRISDLDKLLGAIEPHPLVEIRPIGKTVQGRQLEIVRVGSEQAPSRVFLRARAHPWESGGNWVVQGLIQRLLRGDDRAAELLRRYSVYVLPMANKDGVARGLTRFNQHGKDLNRDWSQPADPQLSPENAALEAWLTAAIRAGRRPQLAIDLHNDGGGRLHINHPPQPQAGGHAQRMALLERLLREHTWFREGSTGPSFHNPGTLGGGWFERFGTDAVVHELNCNWIEGLQDYPSAKHWQAYGESLAEVFYEYFGAER